MSYSAYPSYRESEVEWLGEIPTAWATKPAFALVKESKRPNVGGKEDNVLSLSYGRIIRRDVDNLFGLLPDSFETYQIVEPNNIILRLTDLQNDKRSLRVGLATERGIITSAYQCLVIGGALVPKYAFYLLHNYDLWKVFYGMGSGVRQSMAFVDLRRMPLLIPSHDEQLAIANFLDRETAKIDTLIDKQKQLIKLLEEKRHAVISHAVTKGLNPDVRMKGSGVEWLGEVPEHWDIKKFSHVARIGNGQVDPRIVPYRDWILIAPNHVESGTGRLLFTETAAEQGADSGKYVCTKGQIIYSKIRPALAKVVICQEKTALCSADMYPIAAIAPLSVHYLFWFMLSRSFTDATILDSSRVAMPKVNRETIALYKICCPPAREQNDICAHIAVEMEAINNLRARAEVAMALMSERRMALISAAVTGKIDIRNAVQPKERLP